MKKIALLLAALLVFGLLAGCNAEEEKKVPDFVVPGYHVNLYDVKGWTQAEESRYDLELTKDNVTLAVIAYAPTDFVDMPAAEDLYRENLDDLFEGMTDVTVKEKKESYKVGGNKLISTLYSAKSEDSTKQYYCFMVSFDDAAGSVAFVVISASEKTMKDKKADFKAIVDAMDANGPAVTQEDLDAMLEEEMGLIEGEDGEVAPDEDVYTDESFENEEPEFEFEGSGGEEPELEIPEVGSDEETSGETTEPVETAPATTEPAETSPEGTTGETTPATTEGAATETTGATTPEQTEAASTNPTE